MTLQQIIVLALLSVCPAYMLGMRTAHNMWPPLLWCAHEAPQVFAKKLQEHNISVETYVTSQLKSARTRTMHNICAQTGIRAEDITAITCCIHLIKWLESEEAKIKLFPQKTLSQAQLHKKFPIILTG